MKPSIKYMMPWRWTCRSGVRFGYGNSPKEAYEEWLHWHKR